MNRTVRRAAALAALLVMSTPLGAVADPAPKTDGDSPTPWNSNITVLKKNIEPLEKNIEPLETITSDGAETAITLQADVLFEFGTSELGSAAGTKIEELVAEIPQGATVRIGGHTDDIPYSRGNDVLSQERAQAVADVAGDARPDLILEVTGYGDTEPVAPNSSGGKDDPAGRAENRRVEIRYDG